MSTRTIGEFAADLRANGPATVRHNGVKYRATAWTSFDRGGPTWPQIEAARDCACPTCQAPMRKENR